MDRRPLAFAAACAALATAVYLIAMHVALAQRVDLHVLEGLMHRQTPERASLATDLVHLFNPQPYAVLVAALVVGALVAGRVRTGLAVGAAIACANVTTQLLKPALAVQRPYPADHYMAAAAWPSGHTTAVVSLLLGLVIVLPPRLRPPVAVLGGGLALLALGSIVLLGGHYPSDVLGGVLVAGAWSAVALAVSGSGRAPTAARSRPLPHSRRATG
jgi:membrane-associated phospholipid phosphatase